MAQNALGYTVKSVAQEIWPGLLLWESGWGLGMRLIPCMTEVYLGTVVTSWVFIDDAVPLTITLPCRENIDPLHYNSAPQHSCLPKSDIVRTVREGDGRGVSFVPNN